MTGAGLILVTALIASGRDRPVDFDTEVIPILTRSGCNTGLPRRGDRSGRFQAVPPRWRPARDYEAVVHELEGRRVNLARPAESLILAKATGRIDHEGGVRFSGNGEAAERLLTWIRAGRPASRLDGSETSWSIPCGRSSSPSAPRSRSGSRARFDDGSVEDVTRWTVLTPAEPSAVELRRSNESSLAVVHRAGRNVVIARYLDRVVPVQLIVPMAERRWISRANPVESHRRGRPRDPGDAPHPSPRRCPTTRPFSVASGLDLTGRLPGADEVRAFLADRDPSKRERLVDRLLASDAFDEYWTFRLASLFRIRPQGNDVEAAATLPSLGPRAGLGAVLVRARWPAPC